MSARTTKSPLAPDEVRLLRAFRTMDDRARRMQLRLGLRAAKDWPRSEPVEPVIEEDEVLLLVDYRSTDHVRKSELLALSRYYASKYPGKDGVSVAPARAPVLRLIRGGAG
jgi:hypothetical protein